ncbi:MAG: SufS family cysteine desulfurase [Myxococcota bacterium]
MNRNALDQNATYPSGSRVLDSDAVRTQFPALDQLVHGHPLAYLDSAATALTARPALDAMATIDARDTGNVHRGVHQLSQRATAAYEGAREDIAKFLGATREEIVFTRGTTEAINLVAFGIGERVGEGDEILVTHLEHHSNLVPWQLLAARRNARLEVVPVDDTGTVSIEAVQAKLSARTRIVAIAHVSNTLGTVLPAREICSLAREAGALSVVDGAQAVAHLAVDVNALGCDFYAFSGHKLYGPTGIGVLFGRYALLDAMPPWQGGGDMIESVSLEGSTFQDPPYRFEAGTPPIAGAVGLGAAVRWIEEVGFGEIQQHEDALLREATDLLRGFPGVRLIGTAENKIGVLSFVLEGVHPHDIGTIVDHEGVAIRTGHHCTEPLMERFGIDGTARASLGIYNTPADVEALIRGLHRVRTLFPA